MLNLNILSGYKHVLVQKLTIVKNLNSNGFLKFETHSKFINTAKI